MLKQTTLDGKPINFAIYQFVEKYPERFAKYCNGEGITYRGEFCEANTFFCLVDLEKHFDFPITIEMIDALAKYPKPKISKFKIIHPNDQTELSELLNPKGEEYRRPEEKSLEEETKMSVI
jgi:hypothetical protein